MNKQQIQFAVVIKDGTVVEIGRSQIIQPQIMYKGNGIKWFDDSKLLKGNAILKYVRKTVLEHLKDYSLLSGTVF